MKARLISLWRSRFARNWVAVLGSQYGVQAIELSIIMVAMRTVGTEQVGRAFLAQALGSVVFNMLDLGLYPVLMRRTARGQVGRRALNETILFRAFGVAALTEAFYFFARIIGPEDALLLTGFFVAAGLEQVHEMPRAMLAGKELYGVNARNGLVTKLGEMAFSVAGLLSGLGIVTWCVARCASQLVLTVWAYVCARAVLPAKAEGSAHMPFPREGLPFWFRRVLHMSSRRLDTVLVTTVGGYQAATLLGVANRVIDSATGLGVSLCFVAFPSLARDRTARLERRPVLVVVALSACCALGVFVAAPLIVRIISGTADPMMITVVRYVSPAIFLMGISRPLELWLEAKGAERPLAVLSTFTGGGAVALLLVLVPPFGALGAVGARVGRSVLEIIATGALARRAVRAKPSDPTDLGPSHAEPSV